MTTIIVENPDSVPCVAVSEHNPYKSQCDQLRVEEQHSIYFGTEHTRTSNDIIIRAFEVESHGWTIRTVSLMDSVLSMINFAVSGNIAFIVVTFLNYIGYHGCKIFNKTLLMIYTMFQLLNASSKITYVIMFPDDYSVFVTFVISSLFNLMMVVFTVKFIRMIPN